MANRRHIAWLLEGVESWNARREREDIRPDLEGANLRKEFEIASKLSEFGGPPLAGANLERAILRFANLSGANLEAAHLEEADLREALLVSASLRGARFWDGNLRGADLSEADLKQADLHEANLRQSSLRNADLSGAILRETNLGEANLRGAILNGADLQSARVRTGFRASQGIITAQATTNISSAVGLSQQQLNGMDGDTGTIIPEGLERPAHWPELEHDGDPDPDEPTEPGPLPARGKAPFVFFRYDAEEQSGGDEIRKVLENEGFSVSWDRTSVQEGPLSQLVIEETDAAACVLILWTESNAKHGSTQEIGARAEREGKLVQALVNPTVVPFLNRSRSVDMTHWDGSAEHPAMQKLIRAIRLRFERQASARETPDLPDFLAPRDIAETDGRLRLADVAPPTRNDLENLHTDLREDLVALKSSGGFHNISITFDTTFSRFVRVADASYHDLDQTRFGVQTKALRLRFDTHRDEIAGASTEKLGDLEAVLLSAELLAARLPDWVAFLAETQDDREAIAQNADEVDVALKGATEAMEADPAHYDAPLAARLREYWDTKTIEAHMAAIRLLNDAAFIIAREVRTLAKVTVGETRKLLVKGLAVSFVATLGTALAKLAGVLPAEFNWLRPWLEYIPTILK